jgi:uncharacterized protein YfiM (DUF2279 family)
MAAPLPLRLGSEKAMALALKLIVPKPRDQREEGVKGMPRSWRCMKPQTAKKTTVQRASSMLSGVGQGMIDKMEIKTSRKGNVGLQQIKQKPSLAAYSGALKRARAFIWSWLAVFPVLSYLAFVCQAYPERGFIGRMVRVEIGNDGVTN